jgi:hypothetical protein
MSAVGASTSVIARQLLWKVPRKVHGKVNFKYLLLTRLGEALFRFAYLRGPEKFLHGPGNPVRRRMVDSLGSAFVKQYELERLGLVPAGTMQDIVKGAIGLVTEGFYDAVDAGRIAVHRDRTISRLLVDEGRPSAELSDGTVLPADLVVCATGFTQGVPFLDQDVQQRLLDDNANFMLYRQVLPVDVPDLYFAGYNSSFFSPLNAEIGALWIAGHLADQVDIPDAGGRRQAVVDRLAFMDVATNGHHCRGTKIIPFSLHNVDELLADLGTNINPAVRARHWLAPVEPAAYRGVVRTLTRRAAAAGTVRAEPRPVQEPV